MAEKVYVAIDLKSLYASVECVARGEWRGGWREVGRGRGRIAADSENADAARTSERCGGGRENEVTEDGRLTRRDWIDL